MTPFEHELTSLAFGAMREADAHEWQLAFYREAESRGFVHRRVFGSGLSAEWALTEEGIEWLSERRRAEREGG